MFNVQYFASMYVIWYEGPTLDFQKMLMLKVAGDPHTQSWLACDLHCNWLYCECDHGNPMLYAGFNMRWCFGCYRTYSHIYGPEHSWKHHHHICRLPFKWENGRKIQLYEFLCWTSVFIVYNPHSSCIFCHITRLWRPVPFCTHYELSIGICLCAALNRGID